MAKYNANSASIGTIAYEDTKPAPREEIEAQAKKGIIKSSRLNKQLVSNVIFEYANDYGINSRRRRKMTCERDEEFLRTHLSDFEFLGFIPYDGTLIEADLNGVSPFDADSPSKEIVKAIAAGF